MRIATFVQNFISKNWNGFHFDEKSSSEKFSFEKDFPDDKVAYSRIYDFSLIHYKLPIILHRCIYIQSVSHSVHFTSHLSPFTFLHVIARAVARGNPEKTSYFRFAKLQKNFFLRLMQSYGTQDTKFLGLMQSAAPKKSSFSDLCKLAKHNSTEFLGLMQSAKHNSTEFLGLMQSATLKKSSFLGLCKLAKHNSIEFLGLMQSVALKKSSFLGLCSSATL